MHRLSDLDLVIHGVTKIEGHTDLELKIRQRKVVDVKLKINENKRFYTQAIRGKAFNNVSQLVSRICGTCSIAHQMACTQAIENACNIEVSEQTVLLRSLLLNGLMMRDHAMHLYLFALPDVLRKESILEFNGKEKKYIEDAFSVKKAGNELCTLIGGRAIHPMNMMLGYFIKLPEKEKIKKTLKTLQDNRMRVLDLIEVFNECNFELNTEHEFLALVGKEYNFNGFEIQSTQGFCIPKPAFGEYLARVIFPFSQATGFELEGKPYMVGAIARLNLNGNALHEKTKADIRQALKRFPSNNVFLNNLAQAIEILHCIDKSIEVLESIELKEETKPEIKAKDNTGIGVIEAPRGTLYYSMEVTSDGKIRKGDLVIPTQQNQVSMQLNIKKLVEEMLEKNIDDKHQIQHEIEKLIRAYDPCMSCASHFLKIKWTEI